MINNELTEKEAKQLITNINLFQGMQNHEGLINFITKLKRQHINANTVLFREGALGKEGFIILEGNVEVKRKSLSGDDFLVAILQANKKRKVFPLIGERSFCTHSIRSASVSAVTDIKVLKITNTKFKELCTQFPEIGLNVYRVMCDILQERLYVANRNVMAIFHAYVDEISATSEVDYYSNLIK